MLKNKFIHKDNVRRILLVQLGDIGDVVCTSPTIRALKVACPNAKLSLLLRPGHADLVSADPAVHQVFEVGHSDESGGERFAKRMISDLKLIRKLRQERFDMVIDLRADDRGAFMTRLTGSPIRVAQYYRNGPFWRHFLFNRLVELPPERGRAENAARQSLAIIQALGVEAQDVEPRIFVSDVALKTVRMLLGQKGLIPYQNQGQKMDSTGEMPTQRWITVNPFARWSYKEWHDENWIHLFDWLWSSWRIAVVMIGSWEESQRSSRISEKVKGLVISLAGLTNLAELAALLSISPMHVGVDSAAPHIAAAVGTPTLSLYGPTDWRYWNQGGDLHRVVVSDMGCIPCRRKGCEDSGRSRCLDVLGTDKVQDALEEMLEMRFNKL